MYSIFFINPKKNIMNDKTKISITIDVWKFLETSCYILKIMNTKQQWSISKPITSFTKKMLKFYQKIWITKNNDVFFRSKMMLQKRFLIFQHHCKLSIVKWSIILLNKLLRIVWNFDIHREELLIRINIVLIHFYFIMIVVMRHFDGFVWYISFKNSTNTGHH